MPTAKRELPFFVGRYRCEQYLGGGMADVYKARDTELPRDVAIKILKQDTQDDPETLRSFIDEVNLACQCQHENIVTTFDKGTFEGLPFIVMEFLRGESLQSQIKRGAIGDHRQALRIALQVARAMKCVHAQGIIHRDLKPANVQIDENGKAKLVDFGIAKFADWNRTQAGFTKGTAYYMAPEQVLAKDVSFPADIWAFGAVMFETLSGQRPFQRDRLDELWGAILHGDPDWPQLAACGVPGEIAAIVRRCLEKNPADRYSNFGEVADDIEALLTPTAATAVPRVSLSDQSLVETQVAPSAAGIVVPAQPPQTRSSSAVEVPEVPATPPATIEESKGGAGKWIAIAAGVVVLAAGGAFLVNRASRSEAPPKAATQDSLPARLAFPKSGDMVLVPAGPAMLGRSNQKFDIPAFYIDVTEVTNAAYATFIRETNHPRPKGFADDKPDLPVVNVTVDDARAFARWAGKRLPTEFEWEKTARGADGRMFPWGDQADARLANVADNPDYGDPRQAMGASSFANVPNLYGAINLVGNVWEWVDAQHQPEPEVLKELRTLPGLNGKLSAGDPFVAIRGGAYNLPLTQIRTDDYTVFPAKHGYENIGFRCAKSPQ
ncbi:MAG: protein kinase [Bryobacterales bacterium]|nr:protein kinase [Bryobacterales bacterium]